MQEDLGFWAKHIVLFVLNWKKNYTALETTKHCLTAIDLGE